MTRKVSAPFTFFARAAAGERPRTPAPRAPGGREAAVWGGTSDEGRARGQPAGGRARGACPRSPPGPLPRGPSSSPTRPAPQGPGAPGASTSRAGPTRPGDARGPPAPGLRRPESGNTWSLRAKSAHHRVESFACQTSRLLSVVSGGGQRRARKACRFGGELPVPAAGFRSGWELAGLGRGGGMSEERAAPASAVSLGEVRSWPEALCRRELPSVLPQLLSMYQHSDNWMEHIQILKVIVEMFLPHMNHLTLEDTLFSQVLPKTVELFDDMMCELTSQARGLSSQNVEIQTTLRNILQTMVQLLGALSGCVQHVCATQESIVLESINSLPSSVLHVIKSTFVHCKNSESVYSGHLHLVSDLLQALFKEAYSLQKQLMELLDMVCVGPSGDESGGTLSTAAGGSEDLLFVIHSLLDICSVISSMDHAFHANTWKFIIKQSIKHQAMIKSQLKHSAVVSGLCEDTLLSFHSCVQLAEQTAESGAQDTVDYRLFQKTLKLCRFFANSLLHYTKEFLPFLSDSCCALHQLYLQIHSKLPPSLYAAGIPDPQQEEIAAAFLVTLDLLISQLLTFQPFVQVVLDSKLELPCELQLPQCLLLVVILEKLPSQPEGVQALWCTEGQSSGASARLSLLGAVFFSFEQCSAELSLPVRLQGAQGRGRAAAAVTLYQHVCVRLCAFIASVHPSLFPQLDTALLDAVLSAHMITSLLAVDAWCFLARYGTAELCAHHVTVVAHLIKSCPGECHQLTSLSVLLRRLLFLMAPPQQVEFLRNFSPRVAANLLLWQCVSFQAFPAELREQAALEVCRAGADQGREWLSGPRRLGELAGLNTLLSALLAVCTSAGDALDSAQRAAVVDVGSRLWALLDVTLVRAAGCLPEQVTSQPSVQQTLSLLCPLLGFFIQTLDPQLISQDEVLPSLSSVFALLLVGRSWLLEQHALEAFMQFAEGTNQEEIVPQCLSSEETKNKVVSFLEKAGCVEETAAARVERVKQEKGVFSGPFANSAAAEGAKGSSSQPYAKRARPASPLEEEYRSALRAAAGALEVLEVLLPKAPAPDWLLGSVELLQQRLGGLRRGLLSGARLDGVAVDSGGSITHQHVL
ncbi:FIGNL1-interacting regulator of recombination and mitosis isoform X5 [Manis javanica]|uniref:FIGNL1-interacting regulator of recombination and mitosis isoform X5 n=1 Tax=Manis javanica TaxID=9974 RepID=UPI003C6D3331